MLTRLACLVYLPLTVLQPLLPVLMSHILIASRIFLFISPFLLLNKSQASMGLYISFIGIMIILQALNGPFDFFGNQYEFFCLLSAVGAIVYAKINGRVWLGNYSVKMYSGVIISWIIILISYFLILYDLVDPAFYFKSYNKDEQIGLYRFCMGNPIEIPLVLTSFLIATHKYIESTLIRVLGAGLNLTGIFISQSRILIIIALIFFIYEIMRLRYSFVILFLTATIFLHDSINEVFRQVVERFIVDDQGSASDRLHLLRIFESNFDIKSILFGDGVGSSYRLYQGFTQLNRSLESTVLEILVDFGIFGFVAVLTPIVFPKLHIKKYFNLNGVMLVLLAIQSFGFLPVTTLLPLVSFSLGLIAFAN